MIPIIPLLLVFGGAAFVLAEGSSPASAPVLSMVRTVKFADGTTRDLTITAGAEVSLSWHASSAADYAALSSDPGYLLARELVIAKLAYVTQSGLLRLDQSPDLVLLGLTESDVNAWSWPAGTVGAALAEAYAEAPGAPGQLLEDYGLRGTSEGSFAAHGVAYLPRFLLPLDASLDVVDEWSVRPPADQYGRSKPPGSPPPGLTLAGFKDLLNATEQAIGSALADVREVIHSASSSPFWTMAQTGFAFVPGLQAVSVGMAAAQAYGNGLSLGDVGLAAARAALPAAAQPAWDVGIGIASGKSATAASIDAARRLITDPDQRLAFDTAVSVAQGESPAPELEAKAHAEAQDAALYAVSSWW